MTNVSEPESIHKTEGLGDLTVEIWRGAAEGEFASYKVPHQTSQTILDVVTYVQRKLDPGLSYRFACRVGMCGSCAMTVNGSPRWTCRTHVSEVLEDGNRVRIGPLRNLPVIKDLATDMTEFFDKWARAGGQFKPSNPDALEFATVEPGSKERREADAGVECIGCGVCYAACDVVNWNKDYLGPAALNRAWTLVNDVRDAAHDDHIAAVAVDAGCHACHTHGNCANHCPKGINPTASIAGLKRAAFGAALRGKL